MREVKIRVFKKDSNWTMAAILFKENKDKIFVYSDSWARIEHHFPKHSYYYKKTGGTMNGQEEKNSL